MRVLGWCRNGYHVLPAAEVVRRARLARLDALIIKYGDPAFERAITAAGIAWGTERFAYASQPEREATMLADAVDAGAHFAVANCEPNDGGGWGDAGADRAIRALIDGFRRRHPAVPLYICADLRRGRSLDAPFVREAARGGIGGWLPMVYPGAFRQSVTAAFDAAYPAAAYLGLPCAPAIQVYGGIGAAAVREQITEAQRRGASWLSAYVVEAATAAELAALASVKAAADLAPTHSPSSEPPPAAIDPNVLRDTALAYLRGTIAILDHGTPEELRAWAALFAGAPKP